MGEPDAARLRGVRWILVGFGLIGASLALSAQPAQAGVTDQLVSTTATVSKAADHAVSKATRVKAKTTGTTRAKTPVTTKARTVVRQMVRRAEQAPVVRQVASKPVAAVVKHVKVAPVIEKARETVHRVVERTVTPVKKTVKDLPKPLVPPVVTSAGSPVHVPVRPVTSTRSSDLQASTARPVVASVRISPTAHAVTPLTPQHGLVPSHRAPAVVSGPTTGPSAPLQAPLSDPVPAPAGASSAATAAPGPAPAKATLIDSFRTGTGHSLHDLAGAAAGSWFLTRDPGFSPD